MHALRISSKELLQTRSTFKTKNQKMFGKSVMRRSRGRYRPQKKHISLSIRARDEKGIARNIDGAGCVLWTLIHNRKLANQIARLAAVVVKYNFSDN